MAWGLIGAAVSTGLSMFGGSSSNSAAKKQNEYQNQMMERRVEFQRELNEVQRTNNLQNAMFQDQTRLQDWQYGIEMKNFDYGTQLIAKQQSDRQLGQQLQYNLEATNNALKRQDNWLQERALERSFAIQNQGIVRVEATNQMASAYNDVFLSRLKQNDAAKAGMVRTQAQATSQLESVAFDSQQNQIDMLMAQSKAENQGGGGRSQAKSIQSATAAGGRKEAQLTQQATNIFKLAALDMSDHHTALYMSNTQASMAREKIGKQYLSALQKMSMENVQIDMSYRSAVTQDYEARVDIGMDKRQRDMNAYANNMAMPIYGPTPQAPFATPLPLITDPQDHVWSPSPTSSSGGVLGAFASGLPGIVSGISKLGAKK